MHYAMVCVILYITLTGITWGCTGFDGVFEVIEAIRGLGPR